MRVETTSGIIIRADRAAFSAPTPRTNIGLQQQNGPFGTLWQALDYAARGRTGMNFYNSRGLLEHAMPYGELRERALRTAHQLIAAGFRRGDRVAVVAETSPSFMEVFFGCQYAGLDRVRTPACRSARTPMSSVSPACSATPGVGAITSPGLSAI